MCPFFPSLVVLGFECRSLCMINKCSTTWVIPIALYALVNFWIRSHFDAWAGLDFNPPIYTPTYLGWQFSNFFPEKSSNCDPPILSLLNSGDYRHEPLSLANNLDSWPPIPQINSPESSPEIWICILCHSLYTPLVILRTTFEKLNSRPCLEEQNSLSYLNWTHDVPSKTSVSLLVILWGL